LLKKEKRVFVIGGVKSICLPIPWVREIEKKYGQPLRFVKLEIDGETLKIRPLMLVELQKPKPTPPKQEIEDLV
jgi:hypothetical protein